MYPDLYLMRHGQTEWNVMGRMQGRLDSPLTDLDITQAKRQAKLVADLKADRISSPQGRALQTAEIVFAGKSFTTDERLCEIDIGEFSGEMIENLRLRCPEFCGAFCACEGFFSKSNRPHIDRHAWHNPANATDICAWLANFTT